MFSILDSRILDINAEVSGVNMELLMENAGKGVAETVLSLKPGRVLAVCGGGNNGGDGYVASRILKSKGVDVKAFQVSPASTDLCRKKQKEYLDSGGVLAKELDFGDVDVVIDAMLGVGISGEPREPYLSAIRRINDSGKRVVAVDVPSGFPSKISVRADFTVTMQFIKEGMTEESCGEIRVVDVGFPREIVEMIGPGDILAFPQSQRDSHKGQNGVSVIIGGSSEFFGAPVYVAKSAQRMGVDLVFLFAPKDIHQFIACNAPDVILRQSGIDRIEFNYGIMKAVEEREAAVAVGPGITKDEKSVREAEKIIRFSLSKGRKVVVDADALMSSLSIGDFKGNAVLTPHRGEFRSAFDLEPTEENVLMVAKRINAVILLKGSVDIVTDGETVKRNERFHHQSMTRGGTGDILTGAVAGLLARGVDPLHASFLASYIVGSAGLEAFREKGYSYFTSEILDLIPDIITGRKKST
ncbi:MAG: NAD(P)H-hydrate dehydratase [Thermoplasmata archaeon]